MEDITFPDLPHELTLDAAQLAQQRRRDAARKRVRNTIPPLPELRFEMAYLRTIIPACSSTSGGSVAQDIDHGKAVVVDWRSAAWITVKDQVISPLFQGMFWGLLSVLGGGVLASMKAGLGFGSGVRKQSPGDFRTRDGASWRDFAKTGTGAIETSAVL